MIHNFILTVPGKHILDQIFIDACYNAGCDDALISMFDEQVCLEFDREADTREGAIESAIKAVQRAGYWAKESPPATSQHSIASLPATVGCQSCARLYAENCELLRKISKLEDRIVDLKQEIAGIPWLTLS